MFTNQNNFQKDKYFMSLALNQARKTLGNTKENPAVGCVVVKNNNVIGAGFTSLNGRPHAEQNAINICKKKIKNSNLYITLEPCSNYGFTKPCVNLIIKNKIKKVFFSINDPDKRSYKKSLKKLKKNKISVSTGVLKKEINLFYKSYLKSKNENMPFVTSKMAISKDFFTIDSKNKWITNKFSRGRVHLMRANHDCILTSSKTVNLDNSKLTCRISGLSNLSPSRVILDKNLSLKRNCNILKDAFKHKTIIFYNKSEKVKLNFFKKIKVKLFKAPLDESGNLNLKFILLKIKKMGYSRVFLETGVKLTSSFFNNNLVDNFVLFISSRKLGARGMGRFKNYMNKILKNRKGMIEKVNLFGDRLISYKINK